MTCATLYHRFFNKSIQSTDAMGRTSIFCCGKYQFKRGFLKFFGIKKKLKIITNHLCLSTLSDLSPASDVHLINGPNTEVNPSDEFRYFNGRRYHNSPNSRYCWPNDSISQNRIHEYHEVTKLFWGSNFSAPIEETLTAGGMRVLDIGCGPGSWILDLCQRFPNCHFTGIDISDIFSCETRPENVSFTKANVLDGLPFATGTFDYVHMRYMIHSLSEKEWVVAISEAVRLLKPGGYLELSESDISLRNDGPITKCLMGVFIQHYKSRGIAYSICDRMEPFLRATPKISRIDKHAVPVPVGKWGGNIGVMMSDVIVKTLQSFRSCFSSAMGLELEEFDNLLESWVREIDEYQSFQPVYRWCAQKSVE